MQATVAIFFATGLALPRAEAAPADHPLEATVQLDCDRCSEPGGTVRIDVPLDLRLATEPEAGVSLSLTDANGHTVPFALATATAPAQTVRLRVHSTEAMDRWTIEAPPRPLDTLQLGIESDRPTAATVTVRDARTDAVLAEQLVWRWGLSSQDEVPLPHTTAPLAVSLRWHGPRADRPVGFTGWNRPELALADEVLTLTPARTALTELGTTTTVLPLPRPLPIRALDIEVEGDILTRTVTVRQVASGPHGEDELAATTIRRLRMGATHIDDTTVSLRRPPATDVLQISLDATSGPPLAPTAVHAHIPRRALYVHTGHPGPLVLRGGDAAAIEPTSEVQSALPEMINAEVGTATVGPVGPNPDWVAPEELSGLSAPGTPLDQPDRFTHEAPVTGPAGLVRIPLGRDHLAVLGSTPLGLRLVTPGPDGTLLQVPHLLRRLPVDHVIAEVPTRREEQGRRSRVAIDNPVPGLPLTGLSLHTDAPLFSRELTISHQLEGYLAPVRMASWQGGAAPGALHLELPGGPTGPLVVELDNGDDPPLPLTGVDLQWPAWELIATLPPAGATLLMGRDLPPAEHDLMLLSDQLHRRATAAATAGPPVARTPPPLGGPDKVALWVGLLALVGGLGLLILRLVRGLPLEEPAEHGDGDADDGHAGDSTPADGEDRDAADGGDGDGDGDETAPGA